MIIKVYIPKNSPIAKMDGKPFRPDNVFSEICLVIGTSERCECKNVFVCGCTLDVRPKKKKNFRRVDWGWWIWVSYRFVYVLYKYEFVCDALRLKRLSRGSCCCWWLSDCWRVSKVMVAAWNSPRHSRVADQSIRFQVIPNAHHRLCRMFIW